MCGGGGVIMGIATLALECRNRSRGVADDICSYETTTETAS